MGPTDPDFIELVATEGSILGAVLLVIFVPAIIALFVVLKSFLSRVLDKQETLIETLTTKQNQATAALADSVHKVELAVIKSDTHNTAALGSLRDSVSTALSRIDKQEGRIDTLDGTLTTHNHRITVLETWTSKHGE